METGDGLILGVGTLCARIQSHYDCLLLTYSIDLVADGSDEDACDGGQDVEEAIGQIGECGHIEDCGLRHAAGAPGNEHRGDGT